MLVVISAFLTGVVLVLVVELFLVYRWFQAQPFCDRPQITVPTYVPVKNPEHISEYCGVEGATESETCMFLNLIFQFLWKEWRDSPRTRNFFIKRMNMEFKEMLLNKAAGKLMEQITVRDYHLGESLPVIKKATVMKIDSRNPTQVPREIDVALELEYSGGFIIELDVDLIFGKSTHFKVKLNSLHGRLRLQFTRIPCTHWSFSFYEDPVMDLKVESNFQGRNLPKLTNFIHNQILRAIKKKHTFPRYKVRYKPFFVQEQPQDGKREVYVHNCLLTVGHLDVEIVECTRLMSLPRGSHIYCCLSLDSIPWKEDMPLRRCLWPVHEVLICRSPSGAIGVSFYREFETVDEDKHEILFIKTVTPNSPASKVDIQRGDILLSVNNVDVISMKQAARLVKNAGNKFTFKLQRPPTEGRINEEEIFEKADPENMSYGNEVQESFDYNSVVLQDDESENEEFVNIVVHEIGEALIQDDSTRKNFLNKLERSMSEQTLNRAEELRNEDEGCTRKPSSSTLNLKLDKTISPEKPRSQTIETDLNHEFGASLPPRLEDGRRFSKMRSFTFFKKSKTVDTTSKSNSSLKSNSSPKSSHSVKSSSGYTTDISDNLNDTNQLSGNYSDPESGRQDSSRTYAPPDPNELMNDEKSGSNEASDDTIYEPLGVHKRLQQPSSHKDCADVEREPGGTEWDNILRPAETKEDTSSPSPPEEEKEALVGQKTTLVTANEDPVFNEIFAFDVEKENKFLNICVYGKCEENFSKFSGMNTHKCSV